MSRSGSRHSRDPAPCRNQGLRSLGKRVAAVASRKNGSAEDPAGRRGEENVDAALLDRWALLPAASKKKLIRSVSRFSSGDLDSGNARIRRRVGRDTRETVMARGYGTEDSSGAGKQGAGRTRGIRVPEQLAHHRQEHKGSHPNAGQRCRVARVASGLSGRSGRGGFSRGGPCGQTTLS